MISRREFLQASVAATALTGFGGGWSRAAAQQAIDPTLGNAWQLTPQEIVNALVCRLCVDPQLANPGLDLA